MKSIAEKIAELTLEQKVELTKYCELILTVSSSRSHIVELGMLKDLISSQVQQEKERTKVFGREKLETASIALMVVETTLQANYHQVDESYRVENVMYDHFGHVYLKFPHKHLPPSSPMKGKLKVNSK